MKFLYSILGSICVITLLTGCPPVQAVVYCHPMGYETVCFSDDGRSFTNRHEGVENPNIIVPPPLYYPPAYRGQAPVYIDKGRPTPPQDFGECTLALGCLKD